MEDRNGRKPELVSRMNYLTLLNLGDTIRHFGPLRWLWEGGRMGKLSLHMNELAVITIDQEFLDSNHVDSPI